MISGFALIKAGLSTYVRDETIELALSNQILQVE
jgi:hypothetical protein